MNRPPRPIILVLILGTAMATADPDAKPVDTGPALKTLRADIAAKPSRVLIAVEDALTMNEQAACEIVKEAIEATRADAKLVGEIVFTALQRAPAMAATIVECAVSTSPGSIEQIKEAMRRALGDKAGAAAGDAGEGSGNAVPDEPDGKQPSGKEASGKAAAPAVPAAGDDDDSFGFFGIGVGGIYLSAPESSWLHPCDPRDPCCSGELTPACLRP